MAIWGMANANLIHFTSMFHSVLQIPSYRLAISIVRALQTAYNLDASRFSCIYYISNFIYAN